MRCHIGSGEYLREKKLIGYLRYVLLISNVKQCEKTMPNDKIKLGEEGRDIKSIKIRYA